MSTAGFDTELEIGGLSVTIKNFNESGGDVAIDICANLFPDIGKFSDGECAIDFDNFASTKEGDGCGFGFGRGCKEKTARCLFIKPVNSANLWVILLFLKKVFEAINVSV